MDSLFLGASHQPVLDALVCFPSGSLWISGQLFHMCNTVLPLDSYTVHDLVDCSGNTLAVWLAGGYSID